MLIKSAFGGRHLGLGHHSQRRRVSMFGQGVVEELRRQRVVRVHMVDATQGRHLRDVALKVRVRTVHELLQAAHVELGAVREGGLMHDLRARRRDVARCLIDLFSLSCLDLRVDAESREDLVAHAVVVESQREVALDLHALLLADKGDPLEQATPLEAQESEDGRVSLLFALDFLHLRDALQVGEPAAHDHQLLDLLGLFALVPSRGVESEPVECLSLQAKVDRIRADLAVKLDFLLDVRVEHDRPEGLEEEQVTHCEQRFGQVGSFNNRRSLFDQVDPEEVLAFDDSPPLLNDTLLKLVQVVNLHIVLDQLQLYTRA